MFDILKKKISGFIGKITGKKEQEEPIEEVKEEPIEEEILEEKIGEPVIEVPKEEIIEEEISEPEIEIPKQEPIKEVKEEIKLPEIKKEIPKPIPKPIEKPPEVKEKPIEITKKKEEPKKPIERKIEPVPKPKIEEPEEEMIKDIAEEKEEKKGFFDQIKSVLSIKPSIEEERKIPEIKEIEEEKEPEILEPVKKELEKEEKPEIKSLETKKELKLIEQKEEKKEKKVKLTVFEQITSVVTGEVQIKENDVSELLEEFELGLLEGDVALEVAEELKSTLKTNLIGKKIKKNQLSEILRKEMEQALLDVMKQENQIDIVEFVKSSEKPVKIMFLGINGSGKTTTLSKIAYMLQKNGLKVVFAAADTFRAAAIEQIQVHADKLGIKVIKRPYGSDSTAVVYDAVNHAKSHGIDAVLIDTAGRQDTNIDLINELKKMERVIKPDLKLYIGESIGGNAVVSQVSSFNSEIGLNGVILTKIDCDPKGGTIISISKTTGLPILYITNGQKYEDIKRFDPKEIVEGLVS